MFSRFVVPVVPVAAVVGVVGVVADVVVPAPVLGAAIDSIVVNTIFPVGSAAVSFYIV